MTSRILFASHRMATRRSKPDNNISQQRAAGTSAVEGGAGLTEGYTAMRGSAKFQSLQEVAESGHLVRLELGSVMSLLQQTREVWEEQQVCWAIE